jgi:paraquat-inducible protein B
VQKVDGQVDPLASNLDETVREARGAVRKIDSQLGTLGESIQRTIESADATLTLAQKAVENIEGGVGEDSTLVYQLNKSLEEVKALTRSVRVLADYLERHPESVLWGK